MRDFYSNALRLWALDEEIRLRYYGTQEVWSAATGSTPAMEFDTYPPEMKLRSAEELVEALRELEKRFFSSGDVKSDN